MRKLFLTLSLILVSVVCSFAQGTVQVGWAVITPLSATSSGVVAFETFGLNRGTETTQAGILPSDLTTNSVIFASTSTRLGRNVGIAIVNPQSTTVNVTLTLRREDGTQFATSTIITVPALQQISRFVTELFIGLPADFVGTITATSPTAVSIVGLRFRGANFSTLPITNFAPGGSVPSIPTGIGGTGAVVGGPGSVLLPQFAAGGGWATELVLMNNETLPMNVRVDLFRQDGTPLSTILNGQTGSSFTNLAIPAGGVLTLAPRNANGDSDF